MNKSLCDVLFMSEKRKQVLLLLQDEPKEMGYLLESLDTTRQSLLPQMKILEEHYLIDHYKDAYELTTIGKLVVDQMAPLINAIETFDVDIDYWGTHNIDFIPPHLLKRLKKLKNCKIVNPSITELYSLHKSFHEQKNTESVYIVTNILYPEYRKIFNELMESNVTTNYIVSKQLLEKIKTEHHDNFSFFIKTGLFKLYVYNNELNFLFFTFDDFHMIISLLRTNGNFDSKLILCSTRDALKWGKELFEYYLKDSTPITEI